VTQHVIASLAEIEDEAREARMVAWFITKPGRRNRFRWTLGALPVLDSPSLVAGLSGLA
jgi:hypothetical protein